jgi:hypothetical protein
VIWIVYLKEWAIGKLVRPQFKQQQEIGEPTKVHPSNEVSKKP